MEEGNGKAVEIRNLQDVTKALSSQMDGLAREMRVGFEKVNEKIHSLELAQVQQYTVYVARQECHEQHGQLIERLDKDEGRITGIEKQQENWKGSLKVVVALSGAVSVIVTGLFLAMAKGLLGI